MKTHLLLFGSIALLSPSVLAQNTADPYSPVDDEVVTVVVGDKGASDDIKLSFQEFAPKRLNDNGLPRFAIVGHDRLFYLGIGAQFLGEAAFTWGDNMPSTTDFVPSSMTPRTPGKGSSLGFSAQTSSFYLNIVGLPDTKNRVGLFFKAEFNNGNNYGLKVSHLYVKYRGATLGWTNSFFEDSEAIPFTIDDQGPNGSVELKTFIAGWTQNFSKNFSGGIGLDAPTTDLTTGAHTATVNQRIPAFPLYMQYQWGSSSHVRASAIIRPMQYRNLITDKNKALCGWGVQLSGPVAITDKLTFYFDATYGEGIANYLQDTNGLGLDAVPAIDGSGSLKAIKSMGLTGGLGYNITKRLQTNLMYSHVSNWTENRVAVSADQYRYGDYVAANLFYNINKIVGFGLEYNYGHTKDFAGNSLHANRLQAQLAVTF